MGGGSGVVGSESPSPCSQVRRHYSIFVYRYMYVCVCVYIYVCMYVHILRYTTTWYSKLYYMIMWSTPSTDHTQPGDFGKSGP